MGYKRFFSGSSRVVPYLLRCLKMFRVLPSLPQLNLIECQINIGGCRPDQLRRGAVRASVSYQVKLEASHQCHHRARYSSGAPPTLILRTCKSLGICKSGAELFEQTDESTTYYVGVHEQSSQSQPRLISCKSREPNLAVF